MNRPGIMARVLTGFSGEKGPKNSLIRLIAGVFLFFGVYALKGAPAYVAAALAVLYLDFFKDGTDRKKLFLKPATALVFTALIMTCFHIYNRGMHVTGFIIFAAVFTAFFAYVGLISGKGTAYKPERGAAAGLGPILARLFLGLILSMAAWHLMDRGLVFSSYILYFCSLLLFMASFSDREALKTEAQAEKGPTAGKEDKAGGLFAFIIFFALVDKAYSAISVWNIMDAVISALFAVLLSRHVAWNAGPAKTKENIRPARIIDFILMIILAGTALFIGLKGIASIPPGINPDEGVSLNSIAADHNGQAGVFDKDGAVGMPTLFMWLTNKFTVFTGGSLNLLTVRISGAVFGAAIIFFLFLLAKELYGRRAAVISSLIFMVFLPHLYTLRGIFTITVLFGTASIYYFVRGLKGNRLMDWLLAGLFTGGGLYFYHPAKLIPVIIAVYLAAVLALDKDRKNTAAAYAPGLFLLVFSAAAVIYPVLLYAVRHPVEYFARIAYVANLNAGPLPFGAMLQSTAGKIAAAYGSFFADATGPSGSYSVPGTALFDPVFSVLFLAGLFKCMFLFKRKENLLLLVWLIVGMSPLVIAANFDGVLFYRAVIIFPAFVIAAACGIGMIMDGIELGLKGPGKYASAAAAALLLAFISCIDLNVYFNDYPKDPSVRLACKSSILEMAEAAAGHKNAKVLHSLFFDSAAFAGYGAVFDMLGMKTGSMNISSADLSRIYNNEGRDLFLVGEGMFERSIDFYREFFPNAKTKVSWNYDYWLYTDSKGRGNATGWNKPEEVIAFWKYASRQSFPYDLDDFSKPYVSFVTCYIPYSDIAAAYGLNARFYDKGALAASAVTGGDIMVPEDVEADSVALEGSINAPIGGRYKLSTLGCSLTEVVINGRKYAPQEAELMQGLNAVSIKMGNITDNELKLMWQGPGTAEPAVVDYGCLLKAKISTGLVRTTSCGKGLYRSRDYSVRERPYWFEAAPQELLQCMLLDRSWKGFINIGEKNLYKAMFRSKFDAGILIDGVNVFTRKGNVENTVEIPLQPGKHRIEIYEKQYSPHTGTGIQLLLQKRGQNLAEEVDYRMLSVD